MGDAGLRFWIGELGGIGTSLHALPVQLIAICALLLRRTSLHALATELIGIGEIGGRVGALSSAEVIGGIGVIVVSEGAGGSAGVVSSRSIEPVWTLSHTGVASKQGEGAIWTELYACTIGRRSNRHMGILIDGSSALGHTFLQRLVDVGEIERCALQLAVGSRRVRSVGVGTAVHTSSNWIDHISVVEPIHLGRVYAVIDTSLGEGVGKGVLRAGFDACFWRNNGISEQA